MKRKSILLIIAIIVFTTVIVVGISFAWFVAYRTKLIVVSGDANISVEAWYDITNTFTIDNNNHGFDDNNTLSKDAMNSFVNMSTSEFIMYKFQIINKSERDATLSIRFSNLFNYIFGQLDEYVTSGGTAPIETTLYPLAEKNSGKLALVIDNIYCETIAPNGIRTISSLSTLVNSEMYLWKYSRGEKFIGTSGDDLRPPLDSVLLPGVVDGRHTIVNVYMGLVNKQTTASIDAYRKWLLGDTAQGITGVGQEYAANLLGYSWEKLTDGTLSGAEANYHTYIDNYLAEFVRNELSSLFPDDSDEGSKINLFLEYFEFMGENVPKQYL